MESINRRLTQFKDQPEVLGTNWLGQCQWPGLQISSSYHAAVLQLPSKLSQRRPRGVGINCLVALQREAWRNEYWVRDTERDSLRQQGTSAWATYTWSTLKALNQHRRSSFVETRPAPSSPFVLSSWTNPPTVPHWSHMGQATRLELYAGRVSNG